MDQTVKSLLLFLLLCTPCLADVKAVINGPTQANPGDLVVLTTDGSSGDNYSWIMPENIQVMTCDAQSQVAFASGKPGKFTFILIAADKHASIAYSKHTVSIGNAPPEEPGPVPAPDLSELTKLSQQFTPNDPETQQAIKQGIQAVSATTLPEAQKAYQLAIVTAIASRPRGSQSNWIIWRKEIDKAITTLNPQTSQELRNIMLAIAWPNQ